MTKIKFGTDGWRAIIAEEFTVDNVARVAPLKRSATPQDCAEATIALIRNKYATGQIFVVDGGLTLVV